MELHDFASEFLPHAPLLRHLARRFSGSEPDDLVQETFARAFAARHRYRPGSNGRAWLCRILHNLAVSDQRRRSRDERLRARVRASDVPAEVGAPEPPPVDEATLHAAFARLAAPERRILELAEIDELSYREIARTLDCPLGTVMSRLHRARRRLRREVAPSVAARSPRRARTANRRVAA
jgi:RNA polymerase sigma-70 factor (ECF subfamily)